MPRIRCLPDDVSVESDGTTDVLSALIEHDVPILHDCGGKGRCSTCRVRVVSGEDTLSGRTHRERLIATRLGLPDEIRLACQTSVTGDVTVQRLVLDEVDGVLADQSNRRRAGGPVGREVDIAIVMTDIVGYTSLAEALPAYDIVNILNRFFSGASAGVERHGGKVDNYMGDAVLAFFGLDASIDSSTRAVRAAFDVVEASTAVADYVERLYDRPFSIRVGVHYGRVVVGSVGGPGSARLTAIGEPVNVASRLEAANKDLGTTMLVSQEIVRECGSALVVGRGFDLDLRGVSGSIRAFEPIEIR
jgi:adenylate cyclase